MHAPAMTPAPGSGPSTADFLDLLAAARLGQRDAIDQLFRRFYPRVEQYVHVALARDMRRSRPWISARFSTGDVVQEVFRSVLADLDGFRGCTEEAFFAYLATVVRNRLLDVVRYHEAERRDGRRTLPVEPDARASSDAGPATDAVAAERRAIFAEGRRSCPERERARLRGRSEQQREFQDLAAELGFSSLSAARRAFFAAHALLVVRLRRRDLGASR